MSFGSQIFIFFLEPDQRLLTRAREQQQKQNGLFFVSMFLYTYRKYVQTIPTFLCLEIIRAIV